jgi:Na+:H+ antiporter, NhaA family
MRYKVTTLFTEFFESEKASGILLLSCTVLSILLANSPWGKEYLDVWHLKLGFDLGTLHLRYDLEHWINDGLMAIFFLLIGLEIERELYIGELSDLKSASLPIIAAFGGMAVPALVYLFFNWGSETQGGFGIPMATDIAFALGILSLVGKGVPVTLKIFLTALAVIDDVGAILVIAIFYSHDIAALYLALAAAMLLIMFIFNRLKNHNLWLYVIPGIAMWYFILQSGIHASVAGVLLAFVLPFGEGDESSVSYRVQHFLHKPVAFLIMPIFALANTGIVLKGLSMASLFGRHMFGIFFGLVIGKVVGIVLFSVLAIKLRISNLPDGLSTRYLVGAGFLGGIGFTMAIFVTFLAFGDTDVAQNAKLAVLLGSLLAGSIGYFILKTQRADAAEVGS